MARYSCIIERLRRPLAAIGLLLGIGLLAEAIWLDRGAASYVPVVSVIGGSVVMWLVPSGRRAHPPSESTIQWARKRKRSNTAL